MFRTRHDVRLEAVMHNKADDSRPLCYALTPLVSFSAALRQHATDHRSQFERGLLHSLAEHRETIVRHP